MINGALVQGSAALSGCTVHKAGKRGRWSVRAVRRGIARVVRFVVGVRFPLTLPFVSNDGGQMNDLLWWIGYALALLAGASWLILIINLRARRRARAAQHLVRVAYAKITNGRSPVVIGAELEYRAREARCVAEVRELWCRVESELERGDGAR